MENIQEFPSGARSSGNKSRYDLLPVWALQRIAARFAIGADRYGEDNWKRGMQDPEWTIDRLNHAIEHLYDAIQAIKLGGIPHRDDDLSAVIVNAIFAMGYERAAGIEPSSTPSPEDVRQLQDGDGNGPTDVQLRVPTDHSPLQRTDWNPNDPYRGIPPFTDPSHLKRPKADR
jgi:hypothetical protein